MKFETGGFLMEVKEMRMLLLRLAVQILMEHMTFTLKLLMLREMML